jgi:hypothetical protein
LRAPCAKARPWHFSRRLAVQRFFDPRASRAVQEVIFALQQSWLRRAILARHPGFRLGWITAALGRAVTHAGSWWMLYPPPNALCAPLKQAFPMT